MLGKVTATTVVLLAIVGSGAAAAADQMEGVTVTSNRPVAMGNEARAVGVCGDMVVSKLLPNHAAQLRVVVPYSGAHQVIENASIRHMDVELTATHSKTGDLLATASCTVDKKGTIEAMTIKLKDGTVLAELKPRDIRVEGHLSK